uniref:Uncharacterized protein n=1 Tax=Anguilla anguilla TaxID=7936 RepID=A0A0E9UX55_ANGAN
MHLHAFSSSCNRSARSRKHVHCHLLWGSCEMQ